jgi:hypothetical protein
MALKIERYGRGFRVTSPGDRVANIKEQCADTAEVVQVVEHYYGPAHVSGGSPKVCPLCRRVNKQEHGR